MTDETPQFTAPNNPPTTRPARQRTCMRWGCIGGVVLLLLLIAGVVVLRLALQKKYGDHWAEMQRASTEVAQLPPEWHQPADQPSMEVVQFFHDFTTSVSQVRETHDELLYGDFSLEQDLIHRMETGDTFSPEEETSISALMADLLPLIDQTSQGVQRSDYTVELDLWGSSSSFLELQTFTKLTAVAGYHHLRRGDAAAAMEAVTLPLRLVKRPPQSSLITHTICIAVASISSHNINELALQTTDTASIRQALDVMTRLKPEVFPGDLEHWHYTNSLGILRFAAANGYPVDLTPQTLAEYYQQSGTRMGQFYSRWIVENFPADDMRAQTSMAHLYYYQNPFDMEAAFKTSEGEEPLANLENYMTEWDAQRRQMTLDLDAIPPPTDTATFSYKLQERVGTLLLGIHPYALTYGKDIPNIEEIITRSRVAMATYDLTRLSLARRLEELGAPVPAEAPASNPTDLTRYISPIPADPFTSDQFLFSDKLGQHYSIGPDKKSQDASIIYNSTNGTISTGDLWVR